MPSTPSTAPIAPPTPAPTAPPTTPPTGPADPVAFIRALLRAAHDALGVAGMGDREQRQRECRSRKISLAGEPAGSVAAVLIFILFIFNSLMVGRDQRRRGGHL